MKLNPKKYQDRWVHFTGVVRDFPTSPPIPVSTPVEAHPNYVEYEKLAEIQDIDREARTLSKPYWVKPIELKDL